MSAHLLATLLLLTPSAAPEDARGWTRVDRSELTRLFGMRWKAELAEPAFLVRHAEQWTAPLISRDRTLVVAGTSAGRIEAHDLATGALVWKKANVGSLGNSFAELRGRILFSSGSNLLAVDEDTGRERWRLDLQGGIGGQLTVTGTVVIAPVRSNTYFAVDAVKGAILWRVKRPTPEGITMRGQAMAAVDAGADRAYLGFSDGALLGVSLSRGEVLWTTQLAKPTQGFADVDADPVLIDGGKTVIAASYAGGLFALDAASGRVAWKKEDRTQITGLVAAGSSGVLVATAGDGTVLGLGEDGRVHWRYRLRKGAPNDPVYLGRGLVAVGNNAGALAILDARTGKPRQLVPTADGTSAQAAWRDPDLVLFSNKGLLLALRYGRGSGITH